MNCFDNVIGKDIRSWKDLKNYKDISLIYHLAAITSIPNNQKEKKVLKEVNVEGTRNISKLGLREGSKIVYISSYIYGFPHYLPIDEQHPKNPTNYYAESKVLAENILKAYNKDFDIPITIFRPFNIFGLGQKEGFLIPTILDQLKSGRIKLQDPMPKRDFVYIDDVIDCLLKAAKYNNSYDIFNLGYGKSVSVREVVNMILSFCDKTIKIDYTNKKRANETNDCYADVSKAKDLLNWKPKTSFKEGIEKMMKQLK